MSERNELHHRLQVAPCRLLTGPAGGGRGDPPSRRSLIGAGVAAGLLLVIGWCVVGAPERGPFGSNRRALLPPPGTAAVNVDPLTSQAAEPLAARATPAATQAPAVAAEPPGKSRDDANGWAAIKVAFLPEDLGRMGPPLKFALDAVRNGEMAFCFRQLEQGGDGPEGGGAHTPRRWSDLILQLEAQEGVVAVLDASVARPGTLPPGVVECCRDVLSGLELKVSFAVPGQRHRYIYEIEE